MATLPLGPHRLEQILRYCIDLSKKMLEANGAFYPFGAIIDASGNMRPVAAELQPEAKTPQVYRFIQQSMRAQFQKGEIVAGCVVAQVITPPEVKGEYPDAVRLAVESSSISRVVFVPFRVTPKEPSAPDEKPTFACELGEYLGLNVRPHLFVDALPEQGPPR